MLIGTALACYRTATLLKRAKEQQCRKHEDRPRVGLFVTCLVDLFRPTVGFAAVKLLEAAGCTVEVPTATDLLRPAVIQFRRPQRYAGDRRAGDRSLRAVRLCRGAIRFLRRHAQGPLSDAVCRRRRLGCRGSRLSRRRCIELVSFLIDVRGMTKVDASFDGSVTYHDFVRRACASLASTTSRASFSHRSPA